MSQAAFTLALGLAALAFIAFATTDADAATTHTVEIRSFAFTPSEITLEAGDTLTWTNRDSAPHSVRPTGSPTFPASPTLAKDQSYSHTFTEPGTYTYECGPHGSSMPGRVIVKAPAAPSPTPTPAEEPTPTPTPSEDPTPTPTPSSSPAEPTPTPTPSATPAHAHGDHDHHDDHGHTHGATTATPAASVAPAATTKRTPLDALLPVTALALAAAAAFAARRRD